MRLVGHVVTAPSSPDRELDGVHVSVESSALGSGTRYEASIRNLREDPVAIGAVRFRFDGAPSVVLEHGWQSWSTVRRAAPGDVRPERREAPLWFRAQMHADPATAGRVVAGDGHLLSDVGTVGFLGATARLSTVEAPAGGGIEAVAILDGLRLAPGAELSLESLFCTDAGPDDAYTEMVELAAAEAARGGLAPRLRARAPIGWCSWYQYFGAVTPADVRSNLAHAARNGIGLVQIDDGWQASIGEWTADGTSFSEPMGVLASEISAKGCEPGLWTAPFLVAEGGAVATSHPEWVARDGLGRPLRAVYNPSWGGWTTALDTTVPEVLDHLREVYRELRAEGYRYHKVDFCFSGGMAGRRQGDGRLTRAQGFRAGLAAVREGVGDDAFLVGCGCPLAPSIGLVDAMRVSEDVAAHWEPRLYFPGYPESTVAAKNAVRASVLRAPLHRRWWLNDPDCLLLRSSDTELSALERQVLADVVAATGSFIVVSDDLSLYSEGEWSALAALTERQVARDRPVRLTGLLGQGPVTIDSGEETLVVDWRAPATRFGPSR